MDPNYEHECLFFFAQVSQVRVNTIEASSHVLSLAANSKLELIVTYSDYLGTSICRIIEQFYL